jgi:hypothetical protein
VIKNPRSKYCFGKKDPEKWIKVKPETMGVHISDVDMLLIGTPKTPPPLSEFITSVLSACIRLTLLALFLFLLQERDMGKEAVAACFRR